MEVRISDLPDDMQVLLYQWASDTGWIERYPEYDLPRFSSIGLPLLVVPTAKMPTVRKTRGDERPWEADLPIETMPPLVIAHGQLIDGQHRLWSARQQGIQTIRVIDASSIILRRDMGPTLGPIRNLHGQIGETIRRALQTLEAQAILLRHDIETWGGGGCWVLAAALYRLFKPQARLYYVGSDHGVEHVVVKIGNLFVDDDGAQSEQALLRKIRAPRTFVAPFSRKAQEQTPAVGVYCPLDAVDELEKLLGSYLRGRK